MMRTGADEAAAPKYSHVERERRFLVDRARLPALRDAHVLIEDRYLIGTRCRLRRMTDSVSGATAWKLAKKYEADDPLARPMVNAYLTVKEYAVFATLPARGIVKRRHRLVDDGTVFGIDVFEDGLAGLVLAEAEADDAASLVAIRPPVWAVCDVSTDPRFQGGELALLDCAEAATFVRLVSGR